MIRYLRFCRCAFGMPRQSSLHQDTAFQTLGRGLLRVMLVTQSYRQGISPDAAAGILPSDISEENESARPGTRRCSHSRSAIRDPGPHGW